MSEKATLADDVTAAFERACREKDWQTAEFLLQALEALSDRDQGCGEVRRSGHLWLAFQAENHPKH